MSSDTPNASWHPAFMPNSAAEQAPIVHKTEEPQPPTTAAAEDEVTQESEPTATHALEPIDVDQHDTSGVDGWFPDYESSSPWLEQAHPPPADILANPEAATAVPIESTLSHQEDNEEVELSGKATKHASTVSFARTVSQDVNWEAEDEDPEWNLPRADTDPFKFMGPSDRTNSFPAVPPIVRHEKREEDVPLPSSQAEDIMREVDEDQHVDPEARSSLSPDARMGEYPTHEDTDRDEVPQQYVGGDTLAPSEEASDERYAEGLPLIPHQKRDDEPSGQAPNSEDPFVEDEAGDDDFFSQVKSSDVATGEPPQEPSVQRKSTMQVMNAFTPTSAGEVHTLAEEEEETEEDWPNFGESEPPPESLAVVEEVPSTVDATAAVESKPKEGDGLEAQWASVFEGDDDEGFLLDDSADAQDAIDPAAFLVDDDEGFLDDTLGEEDEVAPTPPVILPAATPASQRPAVSNRYLPAGAAPAPVPHPGAARQQSNPYFPQVPVATPFQPLVPSPFNPSPSAPPVAATLGYGAPPAPRPEPNKTASFADKSRGGYQSPYDLPMEVVKPRKRQSMQHLAKATPTQSAPASAPPPRSVSVQVASPTRASTSSLSPTGSSYSAGQQIPANAKPPSQAKKQKENFFEDLPVSAKVRPASRQSQKSLPSPSQPSPYGPPQPSPQAPPPTSAYQAYPSPPMVSPSAVQQPPSQRPAPELPNLVAPPRVNPYAPVQISPAPQAITAPSNKYSPAPNLSFPPPNGSVPVASPNKYSPAPVNTRALPAQYQAPPQIAPPPMQYQAPPQIAPPPAQYQAPPPPVPPPVLPHQPRTSSPLAHFEISHERSRAALTSHSDSHLPDRRSSSALFEPRLNRVPSLPPTKEVPDEDGPLLPTAGRAGPPPASQYAPQRPRQTPPPASLHPQSTLSPPKRASPYSPQSHTSTSPQTQEFVPPQRSQTQSPGALYGNRSSVKPVDPIQRPSSVHDPTSPRGAAPPGPLVPPAGPVAASHKRSRTFSRNLNLVPPTDGREQDPLQRWKGSPVFCWGVGGTLVASFPKDVPRYGMNQAMPMIIRSPGEVKVKNIKELQPLEERLAKFPGPLKGKSKKKETLAWLSTGIEGLERALPTLSFHAQITHEDKRSMERVLLWKILRLFIEHDGVLEGSPAVDKAVRDVLGPGVAGQPTEGNPTYATSMTQGGFSQSPVTHMQSDGVDSATVEQIRRNLLNGDREKAVWDAADKRLWGHALLIAGTAGPELYRKVAHEFVRKEVNYAGHNNESLAVLYEVLSGNHDESVDELVPVHARAGLQLMTTTNSSITSSADALAGLDKWRETLSLVLSNRSTEDVRAINSLGNLLSGYGRAEAAHICFIFARHATVFGGLDDPKSNFVLVGADHRRQADQFAKETEALLLSEVYENGLSLGGGSSLTLSSPHLAAYKLQHAMTLAEYGYRDKALQYCEAISNAIMAQTKRSPYHHSVLESAVEDLMKRLRLAPKEESKAWIQKPSINKLSSTGWNMFNKFVAGDENDGSGPGSDTDAAGEAGPFARIPGGTPIISRPPSSAGVTAMDMFSPQAQQTQAPGYPMANGPVASMPPTRAASRYAPMAGQAAASPNPYEPSAAYTPPGRSSMERTSGEHSRSSYELPRQSSELSASYSPGYMPNNGATPSPGYPESAPALSRESSYMAVSQHNAALQPSPAMQQPPQQPPMPPPTQPSVANYQPYSQPDVATNGSPYAPVAAAQEAKEEKPVETGYQPPSYGYEPPTMNPSYEAAPTEPIQPADETPASRGFEPPSFQPYSYEPPSYDAPDMSQEGDDAFKPKKKSFMDDDEDDIPALRQPAAQAAGGKSKADKDRENAEMFRKAAEEDAKRAEEEKAAKKGKGWGIGGWWGGGAKKEALDAPAANKPIRAKLGEKNSFYYDTDKKRWIDKTKPDDAVAKTATPPPPRSAPRSAAGTPPPPGPPGRSASSLQVGGPPLRGGHSLMPSPSVPNLSAAAAMHDGAPPSGGPPAMMRSNSNASAGSAGPPSRPPTSMSNASSIDDLLGPAGPRKAGGKKPRKSGRYVDVMAK